MLLGVPKRTSNWAVTTETGRYPIIIRAFKSIIKYLFHLKESKSPLIKSALAINMGLAKKGCNSWFKNITRVLNFCELGYLLYTSDSIEIDFQIRNLDKRLKQLFNSVWVEEREGFSVNSKLELFVSLKEKFELSEYLKGALNPTYKSAISKIRLSAHKFPIETERYLNIPRNDRICPFGCQSLGDEYHFLFNCTHPSIQNCISPIFTTLKPLCPQFDTMDSNSKGKFLLNNRDPKIINILGRLSHNVQSVFKEMTW